MSCVDNIWSINFLPIFEEFIIAVERDDFGILELALKKNYILEVGGYWSGICLGSVLCGQHSNNVLAGHGFLDLGCPENHSFLTRGGILNISVK